ncbi:TonB-dependent siderophore receptor [Delftia sp. RIT313]|uniref:TonB-dependent siderophore receptor n=1 Tax=Delftia sp. RIT313 TaxID=1468410 RepID=UPI00044F9AE0|nr:TonB-dependent receptor [Delftia sp. RIT313]EZP54921.1 TonB-dependent siderophore receptor [Delftia sp. RIT313]
MFRHHPSRPGSQPQWRPRPLVTLVQAAVIGMAMSALVPSGAAWAQTATGQAGALTRDFSIAAGPLDAALDRFSRAAGVSLSYDPALVAGLRTGGLTGSHGVSAGLQQLLAGSGVAAVQQPGGGFSLKAAAPLPAAAGPTPPSSASTLQTVNVTADAERSSATEGTGSYTTPSMASATGLNLSQRQTPQSVSVVTRQQMDDFHLSTLQDIAKVTPGLYAKNPAVTDSESTFYARGFALEHVNVDGLPLDVTGFNSRNVSADLLMYDRVEVVRGATGLMDGVGAPSGSVNLVRKRPTAQPLLNATLGLGSWNNRQASLDASRALNASGSVRARVVGGWRDNDSFVDVTNTRNASLYGIVEADLTPDTTLGLGAYRQRTRTKGVFTGLPTLPDGGHMDLPRSTFLNNAESFQNRDNDGVFVDLEQRLRNGWTVKLGINHVEADSDIRNTTNSRVAGSTTQLEQSETGWRYGTRQTVADLRARGPVEWFGRTHEIAVGASYRNDSSRAAETWGSSASRIVDIANWNPYSAPWTGSVPANGDLWGRKTREKAIYASGNFSLADPLHLILGGRLGWYEQDTTGWYTGTPNWKRSLDESAKFVPYAGLVYDVDDRHSVYASLTQSYQPQSSMDVRGNTLDPMTGTNYELGAKGEYFDGRLHASASVFRITQRNRAVRDDANCPTSGAISCFRAAGEIQSDGLELQLSGLLQPGWQVSAGYTYVRARYTKDRIATNIGQRVSTDEPQHLLKLYTSYRLPGEYGRWSLYGSLHAQSKMFRRETGFETTQRSYALLGLGVGYQVNANAHVQLSVDNLLDRRYYQDLGYSWSGGLARYGAPRSVAVTLSYRL